MLQAVLDQRLAVDVFVHLPLQQTQPLHGRRVGARAHQLQRLLGRQMQQAAGIVAGLIGTGQGVHAAAPHQTYTACTGSGHLLLQRRVLLQPGGTHFQRPVRAGRDVRQQCLQHGGRLGREQQQRRGRCPHLLQDAQQMRHVGRPLGVVAQEQLHASELALHIPQRAIAHHQSVENKFHGSAQVVTCSLQLNQCS